MNGGGDLPKGLKIPGNVNIKTANVIEHGKLLSIGDLDIVQ
jgi:hypothetical protein